MTENQIQAEIHRALGSRPDCRVFRNHIGKVQDTQGRWHTFGLAPGSADLVGWQSVIVTEEMIGKRVAIFLSVEVKTKAGQVSKAQEAWLRTVREHGGIAAVARSVAEAVEELK